jgi:hypothetical protein
MSQQYGPPQQPPVQGGWGPGPAGPQFRQRPKSMRTQWIVMGGAVLAVILIAVGVVLLVSGGGDDNQTPVAGDSLTPSPVGTLYTPPTPTKPVTTKGPYDTGVEVGDGVWFTLAKGWVPDSDKTRSGHNYVLPEVGHKGYIDGYFWVRQTDLMDAKTFAEHLADIESNNLKDVVIGKGVSSKCRNAALKVCYAITYNATVLTKSGKPLTFRGFVSAFEDQNGKVTATDVALELSQYKAHLGDLVAMNKSLVRSF